MQKTRVTLSVFHDGQFFTAIFETESDEGYRAARRVFVKKPLDNEISELICNEYYSLRFSDNAEVKIKQTLAKNPKRRQRQAAKAAKTVLCSTKAQQAFKRQQEQDKEISKKQRSIIKGLSEDEKYQKRRAKRKEKNKGH